MPNHPADSVSKDNVRLKMEADGSMKRPRHKKSAAISMFGTAFISCIFVCLFADTFWPMVIAIPCWFLAYCIDEFNERAYRKEIERYREGNRSLYPEVFDRDPPSDLESVAGDNIDLYDCITLTRLGTVKKSDIIAILRTYDDTPDLMPQGLNDIPFCHTDRAYFRDCVPDALSNQFTDLVDPIIDADSHVDLTLRWVEPK